MVRSRPASPLEHHLGYWLRYVSNHVSHAFALKVEAKGVTVAEWVVLRELLETGAVHPSRLADRIGLTRGAISKLMERLCQKQLVVRSSTAEDRRYQTVELTSAGKRLVPILARLADRNDQEFFGHLSTQATAGLLHQLQDIVRRHGWKDIPLN